MASERDAAPAAAGRGGSRSSTPSILGPELLRCLFDEAPEGIALADPDLRYVEVNDRFCEIVGRTREQLLSMTVAELIVPEQVEHLAAVAAMLQKGGWSRNEWKIRRGDGREIDIEVSGRLLSEGYWVAFMRDVSERRRAENDRRRLTEQADAQRRWLQTVLDTVPLGMLVFEPGGTVSFNQHAEAMLGMSRSPDGGSVQYGNRIFHRDGTPMSLEQLLSTPVLRDGVTLLGVEALIERPDGSRIPILGSAAPIRDADGTGGGVAVFQDLSERIQREELIRANERLLAGIFELLPVGVWIADDTGRIVRNNPAGQRIWGGARYVGVQEFGEYRGWWADSGEPIAADQWALARALTKGETLLGELVRIQCFDGSFKTIVNSAMPLYDKQGRFTGAVVVNEDVTELRQSQEGLRRAVEARNEMLRIVSHDLRSPLQSIVLSAQLIKLQAESISEAEPLAGVADRILRVTGSVARLANDLLDLTAIEDGRLRVQSSPLDPGLLLDEVVDIHQAQAESHGIALTVTSTDPAPSISADHGRLLQALSNLVNNALKFVPAGGRVSLRIDEEEHEVRFSAVDTGPGISPEHLPRVFEPFWQQTSADRRGRGLGLVITKGIVEAHGGRIWLESELGHGTTVCFTVPKAAGSSAS